VKSIKIDIRDIGLEDTRWMELADDRDRRQDWVVSGVGALLPSSTLVSYKLLQSVTNVMKKK
jgi:hypothetical protein